MSKLFQIVLSLPSSLFLPLPVFADGSCSGMDYWRGGEPMMGNWGQMMGGAGFFGTGLILMVLFWALIIFAVVALVKWASGDYPRHHREARGKTALDILKERYAKGEIDKQEFEEKKKDLE